MSTVMDADTGVITTAITHSSTTNQTSQKINAATKVALAQATKVFHESVPNSYMSDSLHRVENRLVKYLLVPGYGKSKRFLSVPGLPSPRGCRAAVIAGPSRRA